MVTRTMAGLATLAILAGLQTVSAADGYPKWNELERLFGKEKTSNEVKTVVRKWKLDEATKGPGGSFSPHNNSFTIMYENNRVSTIILYVLPPPKGYGEPHWTEYRQKLPFDLSRKDRKADFNKRFGKSNSKSGNFFKNSKFEIWAHFRDEDGALSELYISPLEKKAAKPVTTGRNSRGATNPSGKADDPEAR